MNFDNIIREECLETVICAENQYKNADGECVDCFTPTVSLTAVSEFVNDGDPLELNYNSVVPDIDSSVVTIEYNGTVETLVRNVNGVFTITPEFAMTFTLRAVTDCGEVTTTFDVTVVTVTPCICPEGLPTCLQLTKEDPADFMDCSFVSNGGDASEWDGRFPRIANCRWGIEFVPVEDMGLGGFFVNSPEGGTEIQAIIELVSCNPFTYQMSLSVRDFSNNEVIFWRGICLNSPVGTYISQQYGVGVQDIYCYENTNFSVQGCFDTPCTKSDIRFDPPSGSFVNFPSLVFLHSDNESDTIYYRVNGGNYQLYTAVLSVQAGQAIEAYAVTVLGCLGDVFEADYTSDTGLEFVRLCDGPWDKAGVFDEFEANGIVNDYHWRIKLVRSVQWELNKVIIYETDEDGVWVTGQAWATLNPIYPIEIDPTAFPVYPVVLFEDDVQINDSYGDPVTIYPLTAIHPAGETVLHAYGQPELIATGIFRLEFTLSEYDGDPFTIYKLIPNPCFPPPPPCGAPAAPTGTGFCNETVVVEGNVTVGATYRILKAIMPPCGTGVYLEVANSISVDGAVTYTDTDVTRGCVYGYILSEYCAETDTWRDHVEDDVPTLEVTVPTTEECETCAPSDTACALLADTYHLSSASLTAFQAAAVASSDWSDCNDSHATEWDRTFVRSVGCAWESPADVSFPDSIYTIWASLTRYLVSGNCRWDVHISCGPTDPTYLLYRKIGGGPSGDYELVDSIDQWTGFPNSITIN